MNMSANTRSGLREEWKGNVYIIGKMSKWAPREGNFAGDDVRAEDDEQTREEENLRGLEAGHCLVL